MMMRPIYYLCSAIFRQLLMRLINDSLSVLLSPVLVVAKRAFNEAPNVANFTRHARAHLSKK